jgi:predicted permease
MQVMIQILGVFLLFGIGILARKRGMLSGDSTRDLARILITIIYPCLIMHSITRNRLPDLAANWYMPLIVMVLALTGLVLGLIALRFSPRLPEQTKRAFLFQSMMNNYLFLPLPIVLMFFGEDGVSLLIFSSLGYEIVLWTLGVFIFAPGTTLKRRLKMIAGPPPIALALAFSYIFIRDAAVPHIGFLNPSPALLTQVHDLFMRAFTLIGQGTVPISFLVAGSRMTELPLANMGDRRLWLLTAVRLLGVPALMYPILYFLPIGPLALGVMSITVVMPCAIASIVFCDRFGGDTHFITGTVLLTHMMAVITVPLILMLVL